MLIVGSLVACEKISLGDVKGSRNLAGPKIDKRIVGGVLGTQDNVLVCEAEVHVILPLALSSEHAVIHEVRNKNVRDPDLMVINQRHKAIGNLH